MSDAAAIVVLLLACALMAVGGLWFAITALSNQGGWSQPRWKQRRGHYVKEHYGSWSAMEDAATKSPDGTLIVSVPSHVWEKIEADPECHPPGKRKN